MDPAADDLRRADTGLTQASTRAQRSSSRPTAEYRRYQAYVASDSDESQGLENDRYSSLGSYRHEGQVDDDGPNQEVPTTEDDLRYSRDSYQEESWLDDEEPNQDERRTEPEVSWHGRTVDEEILPEDSASAAKPRVRRITLRPVRRPSTIESMYTTGSDTNPQYNHRRSHRQVKTQNPSGYPYSSNDPGVPLGNPFAPRHSQYAQARVPRAEGYYGRTSDGYYGRHHYNPEYGGVDPYSGPAGYESWSRMQNPAYGTGAQNYYSRGAYNSYYGNPPVGGQDMMYYNGWRDPYHQSPYAYSPPAPVRAPFPTPAPPPPPLSESSSGPPPPGPEVEESNFAAAEAPPAVPQAPPWGGPDFQAPPGLSSIPAMLQPSSRIVRTVNIAATISGIQSPTALGATNKTVSAWLQPCTGFEDENATTELLAIQALEYYQDGNGQSKATLVSVPDAVTVAKKDTSAVQMRWLHVKSQKFSFDFLERLVSHCPSDILSHDLKQVALSLLKKGCPHLVRRLDSGKSFEAGGILRYNGVYTENPMKETDPVIFLSVPYFMLKERKRRANGLEDFGALTLLQSLYGYEVGDERETNQIVNKMNRSLARKIIHVPQVWCLMIGSSTLVTVADCSLVELQKGSITVDQQRYSAHGDSCLVQVADIDNEQFRFVIPRAYSLLQLRTHLALLVQRKYSFDQFDLFSENGEPLNSEAWISLMAEATREVRLVIRGKNGKGNDKSGPASPKNQIVPYIQNYRRPTMNLDGLPISNPFNHPSQPFDASANQYRQLTPYGHNPFSPKGGYNGSGAPPPAYGTWPSQASIGNPRSGQRLSMEASKGVPAPPETSNNPVTSRMMFVLASSTQVSRSELQGTAQLTDSDGPDISELSDTDSAADAPTRPHANMVAVDRLTHRGMSRDMGRGMSQQAMASILLEPKIPFTGDTYLPPREDSRVTKLKKEGRVLNYKSLTETPEMYELDLDGPDAERRGPYEDDDDASSLSGDSVDFEVIPCSSVGQQSKLVASNEGQTAEQDYALRFKAVWVPDASRIYSEPTRTSGESESGKPASVEEPHRNKTRPSESKAQTDQEGSTTKATVYKLPFFTWELSQLRGTKDETAKGTVINRLLNNINSDLATRDVFGKLYDKAYMCSYLDLEQRHNNWTRSPASSLAPVSKSSTQSNDALMSGGLSSDTEAFMSIPSHIAIGSQDNRSGEQDSIEMATEDDFLFESTFILAGSGIEDRDSDSYRLITRKTGLDSAPKLPHKEGYMAESARQIHVKATVRAEIDALIDLSKGILDLFVPVELQFHRLTEKYWGSLDRIFRQIKFAIEDYPEQQQVWSIGKFHTNPSDQNGQSLKTRRTAFDQCSSCTSSHPYDTSWEALSHIHQFHTDCPGPSRYKHAFDDPCSVWLRTKYQSCNSSRYIEVAKIIQVFTKNMREFCRQATDLQLAVASVHTTSSKSASASDSNPFLPSALVHAFENILLAFVIQGKHLSLVNEWVVTDIRSQNKTTRAPRGFGNRTSSSGFGAKVDNMIRSGAECITRACQCIDQTRVDITLLGSRTTTGSSVSLDSVGVEFLVAVLIGHIQHQGINAESRPAALVELYQQYTARLHFEANRKPRRKVFLDIQILQEELDALRNVLESQKRIFNNYRELTAPTVSGTTTQARKILYPLEIQYINKMIACLIQRDFELKTLQGRSQGLRDQVKQSIEILEEGHGKAIRVFTIVTLFFLPLSFVSSFFGMNVVDIRDTGRRQDLFWSIALPVTLGVLGVAYLYAYKWDSIVGRFGHWLDDIRDRQALPSRKTDKTTEMHTLKTTGRVFDTGQHEPQQADTKSEKSSPWPWKQIALSDLKAKYQKPKRMNTDRSIGE
ncbi:hypothetical protein S7711_04161 [Stachybotrys chartarum IBT 7711]|uniref:Uncharacterized protein n=1 Tax=Stachybotrys chartarum (strain CBS 109288 / IBT 7711) TaxID=1280523 RepID=A0A084B6L6_STACB|nr:hypothetical protein S7711_04161 [Stachybotrys chartarum IBT 7711]